MIGRLSLRAIREWQNRPRKARKPRGGMSELRKHCYQDPLPNPAVRGLKPRRGKTLRGLRGLPIWPLSQTPQDISRVLAGQRLTAGFAGFAGSEISRARSDFHQGQAAALLARLPARAAERNEHRA